MSINIMNSTWNPPSGSACPMSITPDKAKSLTGDMVSSIKRLDCSLYNQCLEVAVKGDWAGFTCEFCTAHCAMETFQKVQDFLGLSAVSEAADNVVKLGNANRRVGVKAGENKKKIKVVANLVVDELCSETAFEPEGSLVDAFPELE